MTSKLLEEYRKHNYYYAGQYFCLSRRRL
ncbi:hypothetical protein TYRP_020797 [Tyrophagus putrescentiae]|nr:hypothetical protein TYRP_020797 [Tyrophagus putrescentiae]